MIEKSIVFNGLETKQVNNSIKFIIKSGNEKYEFYDKKRDNTETKAYAQWKAFNFQIGQTIEVAVEETPKEYNGRKYMERRIAYFPTTEERAPKGLPPTVKSPTQAPNSTQNTVPAQTLESLTLQVYDLERRVKALEGGTVEFSEEPDMPF